MNNRFRFPFFFSTLFLFLRTVPVSAQSMRKVEADINHCINRIDNWWEAEQKENENEALDSLEEYNQMLSEKLVYYCTKYPATIKHHFKSFDSDTSDMQILTSADTMMRIYNWNTRSGGTMEFFKTVIQYKVGNATKAYARPGPQDEGDPDCFYQHLYTFKANGKTYYIATYIGAYSTSGRYGGVKLFCIENGRMNDTVHLIKTHTGMHNGVEYEYDQFKSDVDYDKYNAHFDAATSTIYIPIILGEKMTKRSIRYKFTGNYFERATSQ